MSLGKIAAGLGRGQLKHLDETVSEWLERTGARAAPMTTNESRRTRKEQEQMARRSSQAAAGAAKAKGDSIMVAAAQKAAQEIQSAVREWETAPVFTCHVKPPLHTFAIMTKANWRQISLPSGHEMVFEGKVRASARGKLLFEFKPEMNSELENREATIAEVPHDQLDEVFGPQFQTWFSDQMGVSNIEELLAQARTAVDPEDLARADAETQARIEAEQKRIAAEKAAQLEANPVFGSWA